MDIRILDKNTAEQIAAGEVIENPASVVKELVENALDAGATKVDVEIEKGGKQSIIVNDNGHGIESKQLPMAFTRFATSKLSILDDLERLASLGFRGEALPSIAAVSRVQLTTKTNNSLAGNQITVKGGEIIKQEEVGAPLGTRVEVNELFYNTPGRQKFLRADSVETSRISTLISEIALTNPGVSFTLRSGNNTLFSSSGDGVLLHVIAALYGNETAKAMLEVNRRDKASSYRVEGLISSPYLTRSSRRWITLVVNGRLIRNQVMVNALERGFGDTLPRQRHPLAILNLTVPPDAIDVNVHPAKLEIRFLEPETVKALIYKAVKITLQKEERYPFWPEAKPFPAFPARDGAGEKSDWKAGRLFEQTGRYEYLTSKKTDYVPFKKESTVDRLDPLEAVSSDLEETRLIGQFLHSYLVVQKNEQLLLIDQHAAHERVIYDQLKKQEQSASGCNSQLRVPLILDLPPDWCERIPIFLPFLNKAGFDLQPIGDHKYQVKAVPFMFRDNISDKQLYDLLEDLMNAENETEEEEARGKTNEDSREAIIKTIACHKSIKANQPLSREEMEQLLHEWERTPLYSYCPHGRPAVISFSRTDLDKSFHRSGGS